MIKLTEIAEALGITQQPQSPPVSPQVVGESPAAVKTLTKRKLFTNWYTIIMNMEKFFMNITN